MWRHDNSYSQRGSGGSSNYEHFIHNITHLDPETTIPANDIQIQIRNLQDEQIESQRFNDSLRTELKSCSNTQSHYEDVVIPKFEQHTLLAQENESKQKSLQLKVSAERDVLNTEVTNLTVKMDGFIRDTCNSKSTLYAMEEENSMQKVVLENTKSEYDAKLRAHTATAVADAVSEHVDRVRQDFENIVKEISRKHQEVQYEKDQIVLDYRNRLDVMEIEREEMQTNFSHLGKELDEYIHKHELVVQENAKYASLANSLSQEKDMLSTKLQHNTNDQNILQMQQTATNEKTKQLTSKNEMIQQGSANQKENLLSFEESQKRTQNYILHLTHTVSVLEGYIAKKNAEMATRKAGLSSQVKRLNSSINSKPKKPQSRRASVDVRSEATTSLFDGEEPNNDDFLVRIDKRLERVFQHNTAPTTTACVSNEDDEEEHIFNGQTVGQKYYQSMVGNTKQVENSNEHDATSSNSNKPYSSKPWIPSSPNPVRETSIPKEVGEYTGDWSDAPCTTSVGMENLCITQNEQKALETCTDALSRLRHAYTRFLADEAGAKGQSHSEAALKSLHGSEQVGEQGKSKILLTRIHAKQQELFDLQTRIKLESQRRQEQRENKYKNEQNQVDLLLQPKTSKRTTSRLHATKLNKAPMK